MQQELEIVTTCNLLHHFHQHQVVVVRQVGLLKYRRALKLVGCHLVVPRGHWNAQLVRLQFELLHKCSRSCRYGSEIVVVQLLTFCRSSAKQCAACHLQIGASGIQRLVNQEVFLLPSQSGNDLGDVLIKVLANCGRRFINAGQRLEHWHFVIQRKTRVTDENRRDAKRIFPDKGRRCRIPQRVSPCLKRIANASVGK